MTGDTCKDAQKDASSITERIGPSAIDALPNEILVQILIQLGTVQAIKKVSVVCKLWDAVIRNTPRLFEGVDLEYLAVNRWERIETLQRLVHQGLGANQSCPLKTAHVFCSLQRSSGPPVSTVVGSHSAGSDGDPEREYHDHAIGGRCSVYDASEEAIETFRKAKESQDLTTAWLQMSQVNERLEQFQSLDSWSDYLDIQKSGIFAATTFPACDIDRRTFVSFIGLGRASELSFRDVDRNFVLSILSRRPASVTTLRITETVENAHRGPFADLLTDGTTLELNSVVLLDLKGAQLNSTYPEESEGRIIAPRLDVLSLRRCEADLVLLRSAAKTLTTLLTFDLSPVSGQSESLLNLVLGMENMQFLTIEVDLPLFCRAFSTVDASGRFPCPRLEILQLSEANRTPSLPALLKQLVNCFYTRDPPKTKSARSWFGRWKKESEALENERESQKQWRAVTPLQNLQVSSLVLCQEGDSIYEDLELLVALIPDFDIFIGEGTTEQERLAKEEFEKMLEHLHKVYFEKDMRGSE